MNRTLIGRCFAVLALLATFALAQPPEPKPPEEPAPETPANPFETDEPLLVDPAIEKGIIKRLYAVLEDPKAALAALGELPKTPTELELRALRNLDRQLARSGEASHRELVGKSVIAMAASGDATTLEYLHKEFDSRPERRAMIADAVARLALAKQRRPLDWPLLVRSLTVVKGEEAVRVLQALTKFRQRGTSPAVQRNVLLLGLTLGDERAANALGLLEYWTTAHPAEPTAPIADQLAAWQKWYHEKHPTLPEAKLPRDDPASPHKFADLLVFLRSKAVDSGDAKRGAIVFDKALCVKCHQFGERGERIGPDLSKVSQRLTVEETLQSLLFPNHQILDQYATKQIELTDGKILAGIVGEKGDSLIVLPADGVKREIPKASIASISESPLSAMPSGLADKLTREEIADLFAYLFPSLE